MLQVRHFLPLYFVAFDGEGDDGGAGAGAGAGAGGAGGAGAGAGAGAGGTGAGAGAGAGSKTYTKAEVDSLLEGDRKKANDEKRELIARLEKANEGINLTQKQKDDLQSQLEQLRDSLLTKEELAAKESKKAQEAHQKALAELSKDRDTWQTRFHDATIVRTITDEAIKADVYSPSQVVALLKPTTRLVPDVNEKGEELGTFTPKIKMQTDDGKVLDLTVAEALTFMKDKPELYGNLFKSNLNPGLGKDGPVGTLPKPEDLSKMSADEYRKKVRPRLGLGRAK